MVLMSSIVEMLLNEPSTASRYQQLMQMMTGGTTPGGGGGGSLGGGPISEGDVLAPGSDLLSSRRNVTLQSPALRALVQAAREYGAAPGARELGMSGWSSYRTPQEQADLYAAKPDVAAPPGQSYHQQGLAVDLPGALQTQKFFDILGSLGWHQL